MGKTIIQTIGPLYGEVVNGTVFGRPNGSVYIPAVNTITASVPAGFGYIRIFQFGYGNRIQLCNSAGNNLSVALKAVAESQDTQSYISVGIEDKDGVEVGEARSNGAGLFNLDILYLANVTDETLTDGADYNIVVTLNSSSGVPVATTRIPVKGKVVE